MRTFWNFNGGIKHIDAWEPNCWVQVTCPVDDDREFLEQELGMPDYFMDDVSDADERARYDMDEGWLMIILRVPHLKSVSSRSPYTTIPLGIVVKGDKIITICNQETRMMLDFVNHQMRRAEGFTDAADLVFRLFLSTSVWYLKYLKQVNGIIEKAKRDLDKHIDNKDLVNLSRLQDSLTYFGTSIRGNESLLSKLKFRSTMDTYANIINNNMNTVMRLLTSLNMIILFPTFITSMFGMNLINGMENWKMGFPIAIIACVVSTAVSLWWFRRKKWL